MASSYSSTRKSLFTTLLRLFWGGRLCRWGWDVAENIEEVVAATVTCMRHPAQVIDRDGFKRCAPLRLMTPFYAPIRADRVIYLDLDTLVLCDIAEVRRRLFSAEQVRHYACAIWGA